MLLNLLELVGRSRHHHAGSQMVDLNHASQSASQKTAMLTLRYSGAVM